MGRSGYAKWIDRLRHPVIREWLVLLGLLWLIAIFGIQGNWLWRVDQTLYDEALVVFTRPPASDVVIIGVDDESLRRIGRWPWNRAVHAHLIDSLSQHSPKAIIFDVILTEPDKLNPRADEALAQAIQKNGRVIIPSIYTASNTATINPMMETPPAPPFAAAAAAVSSILIRPDPDGITRSVYLRAGLAGVTHETSALAALRLGESNAWPKTRALPGEADRARYWRRSNSLLIDHWYHIPFVGPPDSFRSVPYWEVLRGDTPPGFFDGKYVLVGAMASAMQDEQPTPVSGESRSMPGIEIQANILQGLRDGIDIRRLDDMPETVLACGLILALMLAYLWLTPRSALVLTLSVALISAVLSLALFKYAMLWWSPVVALLCAMLAYPLWSWRKLEATQRFMDAELSRLQQEPSIVPQDSMLSISPALALKRFVPDVIENRIMAVQSAGMRLRNLNRFISDSLEGLPEATLVADINGRVLLANSSADKLFKARRTKVDPASGRQPDIPLESREILPLVSQLRQSTGKAWRDIWFDALESTTTISIEVQTADSQELLMLIAPLFSARGPQIGSIVTLVDVSPLRESERRRDEALRFLSHDMRSPQASILMLLDMHADDPTSIPTEKLTSRIEKYARRTLNLADDFLRLARAEKIKSEDFVQLNLAELIQDAAEEAWSMASAKRIRIENHVEEEDAWVIGDQDLLMRAIINLLSNAIKYSPPETAVSLTLTGGDARWRVEVRDQGYGITPEDLTRLFGRFVRIKREGQPEEDGVGLGLVFVKTVIERHGGEISVTSSVAADITGGRGTAFVIALPAARHSEGATGAASV